MDTKNPQITSGTEEAANARLLLRLIEDQLGKGQYNNALAWTLDLAKELQRLHAEQVRLNMRPKRVR